MDTIDHVRPTAGTAIDHGLPSVSDVLAALTSLAAGSSPSKNTYVKWSFDRSPRSEKKLGKKETARIRRYMVGQVTLVFLNQRSLYICSRCCIDATIDNYQPFPFVAFSDIAIGFVPEACMGRVGKSQFVYQWPLFVNQIVNILVDMT